ncbi:MAG: endopeptidase La, partial [Fibrobacterota bacterium]
PWEKRFHAFHHIVPAVCRHFGLEHAPFLEEEVLDSLLCGGPRETGWHGFVDRLSRLCRRYLRQLQEGETPILDLAWVQVVLGEDALPHDPIEMSLAAGTVHAMMASSWGGDLARVEVLALPGRGRLTVTGAGPQTEMAARVARSRICALAPYLGRTLESLRELDMHVHVSGPAGPKDGVSLGWPVLAAMVSTLVQRPVDARVAFTGELSLSGAILSVGAVVEKILGAARAGALHISVPQPDAVGLRDLDTSSLGASLWFVAQDVPALRDLGLLEKS